jgi:hypothetical protein
MRPSSRKRTRPSQRLHRDRNQPGLEPSLELFHQWLRLGLSDGTALLGTTAADPALNGVERGDPFQRLVGDRRRATLVDFEELTPPVQPTESEQHRPATACRIGQLLTDRVAVALLDRV